jgi:hypothetical protein
MSVHVSAIVGCCGYGYEKGATSRRLLYTPDLVMTSLTSGFGFGNRLNSGLDSVGPSSPPQLLVIISRSSCNERRGCLALRYFIQRGPGEARRV